MALVYTTESSRPALQRRLGERVKFYGNLESLDNNRTPPAALLRNVREVGSDADLTEHAWLQIREKDWPRWLALKSGGTVSATGKVLRYSKQGGKDEYGLSDVVLMEKPSAYEDGRKLPVAAPATPLSTEVIRVVRKDDVIAALPSMKRQDLEIIQHMIGEEIARQKKAEIEALRAQMQELARKSGFSLSEIVGNEEKPVATETKRSLPAKYRDPETGNTWHGQGRHPTWLTRLLKAGRSKAEFLINGDGRE
jgi:DNA-binding protein H-NS